MEKIVKHQRSAVIVATAFLLSIGWMLATGCRVAAPAALNRYSFSEPQMGSILTITLYAPDEASAGKAVRQAFDRVTELNGVMSDYDPESELSRLSRYGAGKAIPVSKDLFEILWQSQQISEVSDGGFDVTVGPMVQLWRRARRQRELPTSEKIEASRSVVGWRKVVLDRKSRTVTLMAEGMRLDLGGIAKGYAADAALDVLKGAGFPRAIVAASGDLAIGEAPPGEAGWRIGLGKGGSRDAIYARGLILRHAGVSTSGDVEQFVEIGGRRYSHIVDPRTGVGLTNRIGVTVVAPRATLTDGWATALSVAGPESGLRMVAAQSGMSALFVIGTGENQKEIESPRLKSRWVTFSADKDP